MKKEAKIIGMVMAVFMILSAILVFVEKYNTQTDNLEFVEKYNTQTDNLEAEIESPDGISISTIKLKEFLDEGPKVMMTYTRLDYGKQDISKNDVPKLYLLENGKYYACESKNLSFKDIAGMSENVLIDYVRANTSIFGKYTLELETDSSGNIVIGECIRLGWMAYHLKSSYNGNILNTEFTGFLGEDRYIDNVNKTGHYFEEASVFLGNKTITFDEIGDIGIVTDY